jgi:uncharacterized protein YegP (UPF0339 family)
MRVLLAVLCILALASAQRYDPNAGNQSRCQIKKTKDNKFVVNFVSANNKIVLSTQRYSSLGSARDGIEALITTGADRSRYIKKEAVNGQPYFVLKSPNGEIIGSGETYQKQAGADNGVQACSKVASDIADQAAKIVPLSGKLPGNKSRFEIRKSRDNQLYWVLIAGNNEVLMAGETTSDPRGGIASVIKNAGLIENFQTGSSKDGKKYNYIKGKNGEVVGVSETFNSSGGVYKGERACQFAVREFIQTMFIVAYKVDSDNSL